MDFGGWNEEINLKAVLAERMLGEIELTNLTPTSAEAFSRLWITVIHVILTVRLGSVNLTKTSSGNVWAAGMRTLPWGFVRQTKTSFGAHSRSQGIYNYIYIFKDSTLSDGNPLYNMPQKSAQYMFLLDSSQNRRSQARSGPSQRPLRRRRKKSACLCAVVLSIFITGATRSRSADG